MMTRQYKNDWFTANIPYFEKLLDKTKIKNVLEIGSYEGLSTNYIFDNYPDAIVTCIDNWESGFEYIEAKIDMKPVYDRFLSNTKEHSSRLEILKGYSADQLIKINHRRDFYDFVYVDGNHTSKGCYFDMVIALSVLKEGGIMAIDDYDWPTFASDGTRPKEAIDLFLERNDVILLEKSYQVWIQKKITG